jgi:hypothetical protein
VPLSAGGALSAEAGEARGAASTRCGDGQALVDAKHSAGYAPWDSLRGIGKYVKKETGTGEHVRRAAGGILDTQEGRADNLQESGGLSA